jgi:hypothetical protein
MQTEPSKDDLKVEPFIRHSSAEGSDKIMKNKEIKRKLIKGKRKIG